ncbi:MAG: LPS assembly protein LptD [Arenicellales bacterium]
MIHRNYLKFLSVSLFSLSLGTAPILVNAQEGEPVGFADIAVCMPGLIDVPQALRDAPGGNLDEQPTAIQADEIETDDGSKITLRGNAQVIQGNRGVYADNIEYDQESYQALASGNVKFYTSNGDEIQADSMNIEVDTFIGNAEQVKIKIVDTNPEYLNRRSLGFVEDYSVFAPFRNRVDIRKQKKSDEEKEKVYYQRARAAGESIQFEGKDFQVLQNAVMTTCADGNEDVTLSAKRIELDHASGIGTAKNMTVRLKNVPIFYFPTVSFPINDERKTGFLFPAIGSETNSGFILEVPYYINIAPQVDATITPRILAKRGVQLYSELRYIAKDTEGSLKAEFLPSDDEFLNEDRYAFGFDHRQTFADDWRAEVDLQEVSDSEYLRDFANNVDIVASSYVPQRARLSRNGEYINFNARVQSVESVNNDIDESSLPFDILPSVNFNLKPQKLGVFKGGVLTNFTQFDADDGTRVTGSRTRLNPYISAPLEKIYGYIEPRISLYSISYSLDNAESDSSPSASIPAYSIDSGLTFERLFESGGTPYFQTLEPRLYYLNVPDKSEQNDFPIFDTGENTPSSFGQFFRENRFFGGDRVGDTEQVSLGLTSRIVNDNDGSQRMKLSLGQIFYIADRVISLDPEAEPDTEDTSDFIAELTANLNQDWSLTGFTLWDNQLDDFGVLRFAADYNNSLRRNASIAYSEVIGGSEQVNLDFETPLGPRWQLDVQSAYSLEDSDLRAAAIGISYDGCCWAVRTTAQRYLDGAGEFKDRFLITLELDDLGRIRSGL